MFCVLGSTSSPMGRLTRKQNSLQLWPWRIQRFPNWTMEVIATAVLPLMIPVSWEGSLRVLLSELDKQCNSHYHAVAWTLLIVCSQRAKYAAVHIGSSQYLVVLYFLLYFNLLYSYCRICNSYTMLVQLLC